MDPCQARGEDAWFSVIVDHFFRDACIHTHSLTKMGGGTSKQSATPQQLEALKVEQQELEKKLQDLKRIEEQVRAELLDELMGSDEVTRRRWKLGREANIQKQNEIDREIQQLYAKNDAKKQQRAAAREEALRRLGLKEK